MSTGRMTRIEALLALLDAAGRSEISLTKATRLYKRACRAAIALDLSVSERIAVLHALDFCSEDGLVYSWLQKKLEGAK